MRSGHTLVWENFQARIVTNPLAHFRHQLISPSRSRDNPYENHQIEFYCETAELPARVMAVRILEKNLMVLASAGSGKTYQLGNRMIGFIAMGIEPATMVALTFTRKAAGEFTDTVLTKIAQACLDRAPAEAIQRALTEGGGTLGEIDFFSILERFIRSLPHMTLGTMDGFFTKVVKAFPHELGVSAGTFQLVEGVQWQMMQENLLHSILQNGISDDESEAFFLAFRKSLMGRESFSVRERLETYVQGWHRAWRQGAETLEWGPDFLAEEGSVAAWIQQRNDFAAQILDAADSLTFTHGSQAKAWEKMAEIIGNHSTGSGVMGAGNALLERIIEAVRLDSPGDLVVKANKEFVIPEKVVALLRDALLCAARAEMASACENTRAVREVIALFDDVCERKLRRKGLFNFDDIKVLMSAWSQQEDKRLLREALDFRLHAQYGHWLLDEFQDTSRSDWAGLFPLIDEAATDDDGSLFIVGDKKQAIYGWRGGDVRLFDEVEARYRGHMLVETMPTSYRSATEVLDLVNRVCGNIETITRLYPGAADRWEWEDHIAANTAMRGHSRVEEVPASEDKSDKSEKNLPRIERMIALLKEIGIGQKQLSCGVLVRTNKELIEVADHLREAGFRVIEDGVRKPAHDNPIGITVWHLCRWLADPSDRYAEEVLRMSPLWQELCDRFGNQPWSLAHLEIHRQGFAGLVELLLEKHWPEFSPFGKNRCLDLIDALRALDLGGNASATMAASVLEKLEVSQSPGAAHIQVMTIHKSKGLGFDVVVVPLISSSKIPDAGKFDIARGAHWICKTPPDWTRKLIAPMHQAQQDWEQQQQYEAMCLLYVALTRAKRGLYVLLEGKKDSKRGADPEANSYADWIKDSCQGESGLLFESGSFQCFDAVAQRPTAAAPSAAPKLGPAIPRRVFKQASHSAENPSAGLSFGARVHAVLEKINWLDDPDLMISPEHQAYLQSALSSKTVRKLLEKRNREIELQKEVPLEGQIGDDWMRGIIDRMHIHRDSQGRITHADIIDFKTDRIDDSLQLRREHEAQMQIYRSLCAQAFEIDASNIRCHLVGLHSGIIASW